MGTLDNSIGSNNSKSIYDITNKIEEELTYIYEMRMKQVVNSLAKKVTSNDSNQSNVLNGNQTTSFIAR